MMYSGTFRFCAVLCCVLLLSPHVSCLIFNGIFSTVHTLNIAGGDSLVINYANVEKSKSYRLEVSSAMASREYPVFIVARQERYIASWQLPVLVESYAPNATHGQVEYLSSARTLCNAPNDKATSNSELKTKFTVTLSSQQNVEVNVTAFLVEDYIIETNKTYEAIFSPSKPVYYSYQFPEDVETVMLHVRSEDDVCFLVSVQPNICPVYDLNDDITYQGKYQTVIRKGGLTIHRDDFRRSHSKGFVIVFVAKGDNHDCNVHETLPDEDDVVINKQESIVSFDVRTPKKSGHDDYAIYGLFILNIIVASISLGVIFLFHLCSPNYKANGSPPRRVESNTTTNTITYDNLRVSDFVRHPKRNRKRATNYFWHIVNIAIFYGLPVVQLMVFYHRVVNHHTGNLDLCYYNNHCAHLLYFTDFNHVYSNIGYLIFGVFFLIVTAFRHCFVRNMPNCGIPKLYGLYYAMGLALVFEGVLSLCYHICPNASNFQFDTSFMYVMLTLMMAKLYQNRHPDLHASAHFSFTILGIAVTLVMFGLLYQSLIVQIIFCISYILFCIYLSFKIYFIVDVTKQAKGILSEVFHGDISVCAALKPRKMRRFVLLLIGFGVNVGMALGGFALYPKHLDFGTYLLVILLINAIMYSLFYTVMKCLAPNERICREALLYGAIAINLWFFGAIEFFKKATESSVTPAESRLKNKECQVLDFYDSHDIWHILSAPALFFSFMYLMVLDKDLYDKKRTDIKTF